MYFFTSSSVLQLVLAGLVFFVAAPHLEMVSQRAATFLRLGSAALAVSVGLPFLGMFTGGAAFMLGPVLVAAFWGALALAAWQLVQEAPAKKGGL